MNVVMDLWNEAKGENTALGQSDLDAQTVF